MRDSVRIGLAAVVPILEPDDVVLAEINPRLHLDELQRRTLHALHAQLAWGGAWMDCGEGGTDFSGRP